MHHWGQAPVVRFMRQAGFKGENAPPVPDPSGASCFRFRL